jgi:predicted hotdog family 3-hydroxylacyl-ACP dehydratase
MEMGSIFPNRNKRVITEGGTQRIEASAYWMAVWAGRRLGRQIRLTLLRDAWGYAAFTGQVHCFETMLITLLEISCIKIELFAPKSYFGFSVKTEEFFRLPLDRNKNIE